MKWPFRVDDEIEHCIEEEEPEVKTMSTLDRWLILIVIYAISCWIGCSVGDWLAWRP